MAEISDQELQVLRGSRALLDKLLSGKTRRQAESLIKEHYPQEVTTTDDLLKPYADEVKDLKKIFSEYVDGEKGRKLDDQLSKDIYSLKTERSFTDEGIDTLKKYMVERQLPSIMDAADLWEHRNPPKQQEPSLISPTDWGFGRKSEDKDLELLFRDEDAWAEREAQKAWNEESRKRGQIIT
jgi:hypothetical protein